jgi:hypothetical protein
MKSTKIKKGLILVSIAAGALAVGCELIVDFDRTKIPVEETPETSIPDANLLETSTPVQDAGDAGDTGTDAQQDAGGEDAGDAGDAEAG